MRALPLALLTLVAALAGGCGDDLEPLPPAREAGRAHHFDVRRVATGLNRPTFVGAAPGDHGSLWVLEQPGRVVRLRPGRRPERVLDMRSDVKTGAEQGLLGLAFHPDFATNRRLFLHWTNRSGDTRVAEFRVAASGRIEPRPVRTVLAVEQPEENHKGGQLLFGPDGRLYVGLGDGGGAFDPRDSAQDLESKLGKVLSADVGRRAPRWRVELRGARNPWRFSFDVGLNEMWVADVGQDDVEEVNRVPLEADEPPKNLGWSGFEGTRRVKGEDTPGDDDGELIWPVASYSHKQGCSVIGGVVYAGVRLRSLSRRYVYGDFCSGAIWSLRGTPDGRAEDLRRERAEVPQLTHIGADAAGELVMASATGAIYAAVAAR